MIHTGQGLEWTALLRGLLGIAVLVGLGALLSYNRKRIDWSLIGKGLLLQLAVALLVLYVPWVGWCLENVGRVFIKMMGFSHAGITFLLGPYAGKGQGFVFLIHSLSVLIFFSALISVLYHWGVIQRVIGWMARLLGRFVKISGAEGLVAAGNVFLGMSEAPVLVRNYLPSMGRSELFLVMVSGMGSIAGTVMATYIGILGGDDPAQKILFAKHLLSASVMAAPGAVVAARLICPQTQPVADRFVPVQHSSKHATWIDALASGAATGGRLMVNIAAMLVVFIALVALANFITENLIGHYTGLNQWVAQLTHGRASGLTLQFVAGLLLSPLMWLIGIPWDDAVLVGSLLGQKTVLNEFVAYFQLQQWKEAGWFAYQKSVVMSSYILCGFANISSVGILLGCMSVLAPGKRSLITRLGFPAMLAGALVSLLSATIIGMIGG